jgi:hypothetical protein
MTIWLGNQLMLKLQVAALIELVLALHERAIEQHQWIDLSSPYPSKYCILIGVGKSLSDSLWNDSFDLGNWLMLKLQIAALELVLALHERAIEQHQQINLVLRLNGFSAWLVVYLKSSLSSIKQECWNDCLCQPEPGMVCKSK